MELRLPGILPLGESYPDYRFVVTGLFDIDESKIGTFVEVFPYYTHKIFLKYSKTKKSK